jgi:cellulose synthase/poly-beta-1,6-N-acetylglucosamine synthase-like glycosyltransferase
VPLLLAILILFSLRRLLWVFASWRSAAVPVESASHPRVQVTTAFRNEQAALPHLLARLDQLQYPPEQLSFCLIDDGSTDSSPALAQAWTAKRTNARFLQLPQSNGKSAALNHALADAEILVIFDADQWPEPACLLHLTAPFADPAIHAAGGYCRPLLPPANPVSAYATLEAWVHQRVNLAAKNALRLNPPTMGGNCAYRLSALEAIGGFPPGVFGEDIEVSLALAARGGRTCFVPEAVTDCQMPRTYAHFFHQRQRWSHGMMAARRNAGGLEAFFVITGYFDRVVLLLTAVCIALGGLSPWWLVLYAAPAVAAVLTALRTARPAPATVALVLLSVPMMFLADVLASLLSLLAIAIRRPLSWQSRPS